MKKNKKLLHILLAVFLAFNQLFFYLPLNADETETMPQTEEITESESSAGSETVKEKTEVTKSTESDEVKPAHNGKEFVKGVSRLPRKYRIAASSKKGMPKISGAEGVDYGGSCVLSFRNKSDYDSAIKELKKKKIGFSVDGSFSLCGYGGEVYSDAKINPSAKTKIAIIDTGSDIANENISLLGDDGKDKNGHGTSMANLILSQTDDAYIISIKAIGDNGKGSLSDVYAAVRYAVDREVDYILMAISIKDNGSYDEFISLVNEGVNKGIRIIASAGNNNKDASGYLPAGINGVITAGAVDEEGYKLESSNYGKSVDYYIPANSTSEAAAILAGLMIDGKESGCLKEYNPDEDEEDNDENDTGDEEGEDEFTINKSKMTWPTKKELKAVGYTDSEAFGNAVIKACKAMKGVDYGTGNGQADCMRYVNLAYAQALKLISGLKVTNGKISGLKRSNGNVTYKGTSLTNSKYHLVDGCTTWSEKSPHNIGHPGGINIKANGGLKAAIKKLGAKKGSILLFGGKKDGEFRWTHAAIYAGTGKKVYDAPGGDMTAGVPYSKSEEGSGSKTYTHVAALNYATFKENTKVSVTKASTMPTMTGGNACYSLKDTKYGLYNSSDTLLHEFILDEAGKTDVFEIKDTNQKYYVKEITAGRGYVVNEKKYDVNLSSGATNGVVTIKVSDEPVSAEGSLVIEKKDPEGWNKITGIKLSEAVFRVDYYDSVGIESYKDIFPGEGEPKFSIKATANISGKTSEDGSAIFDIGPKTLSDADSEGYFSKLKGLTKLPLGTYVITEIKAPDGYLVSDNSKPLIMKIHQEGNEAVTYFTAEPTIYQVLEDKIIIKEDAVTGKGYFRKKITVNEDADVDMSLYNAEGTTYGVYHKESGKTALNIVFDKDGKISEVKYPDGVKPKEKDGALDRFELPVGEYYAKELHSGSGLYLDTNEVPFSITENNTSEVEFSDEPVFAKFDCLIKKVRSNDVSEEVAALIPVEGAEFSILYFADFIEDDSYKEKVPKRSWLFKTDKDGKLFYDEEHFVSGDDLFKNKDKEYVACQGTYVISEKKAPSGTTASSEVRVIVVRFARDIIKGSGNDPSMSEASRSTLFSDSVTDIKDGKILYYNSFESSISTLAVSTASGSKQVAAESGVGITDTLTYKNLLPGYQYKIRAWLVRNDGTEVVKPFDTNLLINTEEERNGNIDIPFVIDASVLQGETLTVMEEVYIIDKSGKELLYLKHDDIDNTDQQIYIPQIKTEFIDEKVDSFDDDDKLKLTSYGKDVKLTDYVSYRNLVTGKKYKISGTILVKDTGKALLNSKGRQYTATVEFEADKKDGLVKVVFDHVDLSEFTGSIVCVEKLISDGVDLVTHYDLNDTQQTLTVPGIKTSASDNNNKTRTLTYSETVDIKDTVRYTGLKKGKTYQVTGMLMDRSTGKVYTDKDGGQYVKSVEFVAEESDGVLEVLFEKVKISYEYKEIVVFEKLYKEKNNVVLAVHEDINDKDQTVFRPSASTVASSSSGTKNITGAKGTVKITDKVMYKGFTAGNSYKAVATLYKKDGTQVMENGSPVTNSVEFKPSKSDGTVSVPLSFDIGSLNYGESVVIFENIFDLATDEEVKAGTQKDDIEIVRHNDLNNKEQTLKYKNPVIPKTGEETSPVMVIGLILLCASAGPMAFAIRAKRGGRGQARRQSRRKPDVNSLLCSLKHRKRDGSSRVWRNWSP